jgi:hypothetical protein
MIDKTESEAMEDMAKFSPDEFEAYKERTAWESWMEEYTESGEGEELEEWELNAIKRRESEMWEEVHGEGTTIKKQGV